MTTYRTTDNHEYSEFTKLRRYHAPCGIDWIPLQLADNRVRFYPLSTLVEVKSPFDSGMDYCYPQPCTAITIYRPTIEVPINQLGYYREGSKQKAIPGVNLTMCNVRIVLTLPNVEAA